MGIEIDPETFRIYNFESLSVILIPRMFKENIPKTNVKHIK